MGTTAKEWLLAVYSEHDFTNPPLPLKIMSSFSLFNTYSYNLHCHESDFDLAVPAVHVVRWTAHLRCAMTGKFICIGFPFGFQTQIKANVSIGVETPSSIKVCLGVFASVYHWLIKKFINFYSSFVHAVGRYICPRSTSIVKNEEESTNNHSRLSWFCT